MVTYAAYFTWSPPTLTEAEEIEFGRQIALHGEDSFKKQFWESFSKAKFTKDQGKAGPGFWIFLGALITLGVVFLPARELLASLVAGIMAGVILGVSAMIGYMRFQSWLNRLKSKYAAYVAKGGTP